MVFLTLGNLWNMVYRMIFLESVHRAWLMLTMATTRDAMLMI